MNIYNIYHQICSSRVGHQALKAPSWAIAPHDARPNEARVVPTPDGGRTPGGDSAGFQGASKVPWKFYILNRSKKGGGNWEPQGFLGNIFWKFRDISLQAMEKVHLLFSSFGMIWGIHEKKIRGVIFPKAFPVIQFMLWQPSMFFWRPVGPRIWFSNTLLTLESCIPLFHAHR